MNNSKMAERKDYSRQIKYNNTACPEDSYIPAELKEKFLQGG